MPRPPSERRSWPAIVLASVLLLLAVLYVASIGPVARETNSDERYRLFQAIYWPVRRCVLALPSLAVPLNGYIKLWGEGEWSLEFDDETGELYAMAPEF